MLENFTTYIELDPGEDITVTASTITAILVPRDINSRVFDDKGAGHFDEDFSHDLDATATNGTQQVMSSWCLSNDVSNLSGLITTSKSFLVVQHNLGASWLLREFMAGSPYQDIATLTNGQIYYITIVRDESIGTYGTLYCYIYSNSIRTTLVDTLVVTLHQKLDLRYIYGFNSYNDSQGFTGSLTVSNLDLKEAVGIIGFPFFFSEEC